MEVASPSVQNVESTIWFLQESDLYSTVKPYSLAFTPQGSLPRDNIVRTEVHVSVSDLRGSSHSFSLEQNGFMLLNLDGQDHTVDWDSQEAVEKVHYPTVIAAVERAVPGARCRVLHHQVSKSGVDLCF